MFDLFLFSLMPMRGGGFWCARAMVSYCMRYRGFDIGYIFYFH
jgi:hypothetical protein